MEGKRKDVCKPNVGLSQLWEIPGKSATRYPGVEDKEEEEEEEEDSFIDNQRGRGFFKANNEGGGP